MIAVKDGSGAMRRAQERLDAGRADLGIQPSGNGTPKERPNDVILREVERDVARRAKSKAPNSRAVPVSASQPVSQRTDAEIDLDDPYALPMPEGDYFATYITTERGRVQGRGVLFVHFRVTDGDHAGRRLIRFYNEKRGTRLARSSSLWRDYVSLTNRRPPSTGFKPSWMLSGCEVRARVVTVHERVENGRRVPMAECERYSKIDALLEITAGSPPALGGIKDVRASQKKRTPSLSLNGTAT